MFGNLGSRNFFEVPQLNYFLDESTSQKPNERSPALYTLASHSTLMSKHVRGVLPDDLDTQKAIADWNPNQKVITVGKNKTHIFTHNIKDNIPYTVVTPIIHTKGMTFKSAQQQIYHETIRAREHKKKTATLREPTQVLKTQDENVVRNVVAKTYGVSDTPQNVARTTKGTAPEKEISTPLYTTSFLPLILIFAAGVIGVYLVMRKLK